MSRTELINRLLQEAEEFDRWAQSFESGKLAILENGVQQDGVTVGAKYRTLSNHCRDLAQKLHQP